MCKFFNNSFFWRNVTFHAFVSFNSVMFWSIFHTGFKTVLGNTTSVFSNLLRLIFMLVFLLFKYLILISLNILFLTIVGNFCSPQNVLVLVILYEIIRLLGLPTTFMLLSWLWSCKLLLFSSNYCITIFVTQIKLLYTNVHYFRFK